VPLYFSWPGDGSEPGLDLNPRHLKPSNMLPLNHRCTNVNFYFAFSGPDLEIITGRDPGRILQPPEAMGPGSEALIRRKPEDLWAKAPEPNDF